MTAAGQGAGAEGPLRRGIFVTFEGIDGSGKTTQIRRLAGRLSAAGRDVLLTREPGGSPGAEEIRRLLVEGEPGRWSAETEILLFTAARRDHVERVIRPALDAGGIVLCDRFADSTRIYQGARRDDLRACVDRLHDMMIGIEPDLTLILDLDPDEAMRREAGRGGAERRFERFGRGFQARLRAGFLALAAEAPGRCRVIAAGGEEEAVARAIEAALAPVLAP